MKKNASVLKGARGLCRVMMMAVVLAALPVKLACSEIWPPDADPPPTPHKDASEICDGACRRSGGGG